MSTDDPWGGGRPGGGTVNFDSFGASDPRSGQSAPRLSVPSRPPLLWLMLSLAASLAGGAVAVILGRQVLFAGIGWLLSGPMALILLAVFTWRETERSSQATQIVYGWTNPARLATLVVALAAVLLSALRIAFWAGRNLELFG